MKNIDRVGRFFWIIAGIMLLTGQMVPAAEYKDPVQGISIIYPDGWIVEKSDIPEIFYVTDPAKYPWLTAGVLKASDFVSAVQAHMKGWSSSLEIKSVRETTTQDGTKAYIVEVEYVVRGYNARGLVLGIQRGENWAIGAYATSPPWGQYDEAEFLKVLKTLKYKK